MKNISERCIFRQRSALICLCIFSLLSLSMFLCLPEKILEVSFFSSTTNNPPSSLFTQPSDRGMWTVNSDGRLGNQMGQYATLYALAKLNSHPAYIPPAMHRFLAPLFRITLPVIPTVVADKIHWRNFPLHNWMSEEYCHIEGKYVQLKGYPYSFTFYDHIRQEILQEFSFHDHVKAESNRYLLGLKGQLTNVTYVGVHVRRGDYVYIMPQNNKGVVADIGYLEKAMSYFRKKYHNSIFVVASNGMEWCRQNIDASRGDVHFAGDGKESSPERDFALIAHCNHTIMTIGSFGLWASHLAGGETVYLANFTLPESPFLKRNKPSQIYLPSWIGIPADLSPLLH